MPGVLYAKVDGSWVAIPMAGNPAIPDDYQLRAEKAAPNGYAGLGATALVPAGQLGSGVADGSKVLLGNGTWGPAPSGGVTSHAALSGLSANDHPQYEEVVVQAAAPAEAVGHALWVDTDDPAGTQVSEVEVAATAPTNPNAELWLDTASNPQPIYNQQQVDALLAAQATTLTGQDVYRVFATTAARDAWVGPPEGAKAFVIANGVEYQRMGGIWYRPFSVLGYSTYATDTQIGNTWDTNVIGGIVIPTGYTRRLRATAHYNIGGSGSVISANVIINNAVTVGPRIFQMNALPGGGNPGAILHGSVEMSIGPGTHEFRVRWTMTGNVMIYGASDANSYLMIQDQGAV